MSSLLHRLCSSCREQMLSCSVVSDSLRPRGLYSPPGSSVHVDSPDENTGMGCHALLQGIFSTQGLNPGLPRWRRILYFLSHPEAQEYWRGKPMPSPGELSDPGFKPRSPALQMDSLPSESQGKPFIENPLRLQTWFYPLNSRECKNAFSQVSKAIPSFSEWQVEFQTV